ncbi:MAG TPA: lipoate--protein ligase family protein [Terriglobales bacterium]|nr:lipoate--protein ligase family protein [Terriglobales bacterium]
MKYLDLTFTDPAQNLACDEALLTLCETEQIDAALLRVWQPANHFVVLGHSNRLRAEVDVEYCCAAGVPVLRRISGGGTVLQGPGCLNYSLILDSRIFPVASIGVAFDFVLQRHRQLMENLKGAKTRIDGVSDLTAGGRKFSGNSQYRKKNYVLVHGTFLLNFDLSLIEHCLRMPERQPEYRLNRSHKEFVANLQLSAGEVRRGLIEAWNATERFESLPSALIDEISVRRYRRVSWTEKF